MVIEKQSATKNTAFTRAPEKLNYGRNLGIEIESRQYKYSRLDSMILSVFRNTIKRKVNNVLIGLNISIR